MWFPRTQTHPTEVGLTILIFAYLQQQIHAHNMDTWINYMVTTTYHVITATILLNSNVATWTFFCICRDPIRCFRIIIALLNPFPQEVTLDRIVPVFTTRETERVATFTCDRMTFNILHFDSIIAVG